MKPAMRDFLVGLTVLLGLVGVAVLLLMFGEISASRRPHYSLRFHLDDVPGLTTASRVTLNGMSIGSITSIDASPDPHEGVVVAVQVDERVRVPRDVRVALDRGLVGEATLALRARRRAEDQPPPADAGYLAPGEVLRATPTGMLDDIAALLDQRLGSLGQAADSFQRLSAAWTEVGERGKELLAPRTAAEVDAGKAAANIPSTLARIDQALGQAQGWLGDDALRGDAKDAVAGFRTLLDQASKAVEAWTATAQNLSTNADRVGSEGSAAIRDFALATRSLNDTILEVQSIAAEINRGQGTIGQLVKNPDLYNSVNDAAVRLEKALTEAQLLLEKYRKEGLPIRF